MGRSFVEKDLSGIKNKMKRTEQYQKQKAEKRKFKSDLRAKRKKDAEALGEEAPKKVQRTLDNTREVDETMVNPEDEEVQNDEAMDEFSGFFSGETVPKVLITTCYKPTKMMYDFVRDLLHVFPGSCFYQRRKFPLKKIIKQATEHGYTDIIVINEDSKKFNGLTMCHLPHGPTAHFKLSSVVLSKEIEGAGRVTHHKPEVILNNFNTRLGHRIGRMLGSLFHQEPNFTGRRVATFHNQRDFLFFRHHRYIFDAKDKARLQELGPRFTLKLRWLQHGTFDTKHGEYEWMHKKEMDTSRRRFFL